MTKLGRAGLGLTCPDPLPGATRRDVWPKVMLPRLLSPAQQRIAAVGGGATLTNAILKGFTGWDDQRCQ